MSAMEICMAWARGILGGASAYLLLDGFHITHRPLMYAIFFGGALTYWSLVWGDD